MTIAELKKQVEERGARAVVEEAIARAKADTKHAVLEIIETRALTRADEIAAKLEKGEDAGRLAGVPFLAKDNILTFDSKTTASSHMLENFEAPYQATVIEKLEAEGAICIGKTNLDAFAHGGSTENSFFGPTKNTVDDARVAGGSSGGSAVAVATGIVPFALGSDTGGSIRQPASYNGVVGLKPTYGSVSRYGVVAMASSTDVVGPITTCAEDARIVLDIIKGVDERDSTTIDIEPLLAAETKLRIGVINQCFGEGVDDEVASITKDAVEKLRAAGHTVDEVDLPTFRHALAVYYIVVPAELTSNLARYDGIKYGTSEEAPTLSAVYEASRSAGFMDENKRRILIGNYVLSSGYYDAYYRKAQTVRTLIINEFNKAFEHHDVLLCPTAPTPAFKLGENTSDPIQMYLADMMTVPASLAGVSAISVPAAKTKAGLPVGVQFIAPMRRDDVVLNAAAALEVIYD
jgi:aspartyl-tRNA(Asn)/glutamyl-tRNA(Gln) amidotransferase subunit A